MKSKVMRNIACSPGETNSGLEWIQKGRPGPCPKRHTIWADAESQAGRLQATPTATQPRDGARARDRCEQGSRKMGGECQASRAARERETGDPRVMGWGCRDASPWQESVGYGEWGVCGGRGADITRRSCLYQIQEEKETPKGLKGKGRLQGRVGSFAIWHQTVESAS